MISDKLNHFAELFPATDKMPVLFVGHGNPMNAIADNEFTDGWKAAAKALPPPAAILCISAHWQTRGNYITAMPAPPTIHDFGGFPPELYNVQYPAPGSPALAGEVQNVIKTSQVISDERWGLDHGCWSVLKHFYPGATVPIVQMSLNYALPPRGHYDLAKELAPLRRKGILIVGSGNLVHNLGMIAWDRMDESGYGFDWAIETNEKMKKFLSGRDHNRLIDYQSQGTGFKLAIPTPEHFLPAVYAAALQEEDETISYFNDKAVAGSLTMTSFRIDRV